MESNDTSEEGKAFKHLKKYLACFSFVNSLQSSIVPYIDFIEVS